MTPRLIDCPETKAEGDVRFDGVRWPYNTELVNADGVALHLWLGPIFPDTITAEALPQAQRRVGQALARRLLEIMRQERDVVSCSWSSGRPSGYWTRLMVGTPTERAVITSRSLSDLEAHDVRRQDRNEVLALLAQGATSSRLLEELRNMDADGILSSLLKGDSE